MLYLARHGQAGSRDRYDELSDLGRRQARLLGESLAARKLRFAAFYSGALARQRETARIVHESLAAAGLDPPEITIDPRWNEFDLDAVYAGIAPRLAADNPEFRREYERLERAARDPASSVHRAWTQCDIDVVRAWVRGAYSFDGESWDEFTARVRAALDSLAQHPAGTVVFAATSATPIAICALDAAGGSGGRHPMQLAGVQYNASYTVLDGNGASGLALIEFNRVEHLEPALRTYR